MNNKIRRLAKKIKLIAMDVDGVLTGGEIILIDPKRELKLWNVKDGFGFHLAQQSASDIKFAWITGGESEQVKIRAEMLKIDVLCQGCFRKKEAISGIAEKLG